MLITLTAPAIGAGDAMFFHVRLTIDIAVLYYALAVGGMLYRVKHFQPLRWAWTLAFVAYAIHVAFAFDHVHHWSHEAAVRHTEEASGFGNGIFVTHFFTLLWGADVAWWWLSPGTYARRPIFVSGVIHLFMAFIIFNGTVIFESGPARWMGVVVFGALALLAVRRLKSKPSLP